MAIVINNTPVTYASLHGDLIYTVYNSVNVGIAGYKYVCDVYVGATLVCRCKAFPNPVNNRGVFNIGAIVRNSIAQQLNPSSGIRSQEFGSGDFYLDVTCKFGEEYTGTLYTNLTVDSSRRYYNHYNGRLLSTQTALSAFTDKVVSNRPYQNRVLLSDTFTLIPYFPTSTSAVAIQIKSYDNTNTLVTTNNTTVTPSTANSLQQLNVSPAAINSLFAGMITGTTNYYTVKVNNSIYQFTVVCEGKYTPVNIHFLNQYGGFETYIFQKLSRKTFDIEKKDFNQLPYRMDGSGNISFVNSNNVLYDTNTVFASRFKEKGKLSTDLLTDGEYVWLRDLLMSPIVYYQDGSVLVPVTITDNNYETRKFINDKMTALQINIEFGEQYNAQYR